MRIVDHLGFSAAHRSKTHLRDYVRVVRFSEFPTLIQATKDSGLIVPINTAAPHPNVRDVAAWEAYRAGSVPD